MTNEEIVKWLRSKKVETGSLLCLGCGYERNCGIHGCAVMRAAADAMENLQTENAALRRTIDNLTSAQAVVLKEFEVKLEELAEVKAERDAAVADLESVGICDFCVHWISAGTQSICCKKGKCECQWRGPKKEA